MNEKDFQEKQTISDVVKTGMNRKKTMELLQNDYLKLTSEGSASSMKWTGTRTDLFELVHLVYVYGSLRDSQGRPENFENLVKKLCLRRGMKPPRNARAYPNFHRSNYFSLFFVSFLTLSFS